MFVFPPEKKKKRTLPNICQVGRAMKVERQQDDDDLSGAEGTCGFTMFCWHWNCFRNFMTKKFLKIVHCCPQASPFQILRKADETLPIMFQL